VPANRRVNLYCFQKPNSSRTVKSNMTAPSAISTHAHAASPATGALCEREAITGRPTGTIGDHPQYLGNQ